MILLMIVAAMLLRLAPSITGRDSGETWKNLQGYSQRNRVQYLAESTPHAQAADVLLRK